MADDPNYFAYLLRIWKEKKTGIDAWRASLEDPYTGEQRGFASLAALLAYLESKTSPKHPVEHEKEA